jgi:hypothetical protein
MASSRKVIKVFLASPGDLIEERKVAKEVVDEFNDLHAEDSGYQVQLVGWEDTMPGFGRPQAIINRELEQCELFVGLLWMRWGSPPDNDGKNTSGFEEEYNISVERSEREGRPEICLFLKDMKPERLSDPGDQLKRVIDFRDRLESEKKIFFKPFADSENKRDFEKNSEIILLNIFWA